MECCGPYRPARDQAWKSNGSGVVYSAAKGVSKRKYYALRLERLARDTRDSAMVQGSWLIPAKAK